MRDSASNSDTDCVVQSLLFSSALPLCDCHAVMFKTQMHQTTSVASTAQKKINSGKLQIYSSPEQFFPPFS